MSCRKNSSLFFPPKELSGFEDEHEHISITTAPKIESISNYWFSSVIRQSLCGLCSARAKDHQGPKRYQKLNNKVNTFLNMRHDEYWNPCFLNCTQGSYARHPLLSFQFFSRLKNRTRKKALTHVTSPLDCAALCMISFDRANYITTIFGDVNRSNQ